MPLRRIKEVGDAICGAWAKRRFDSLAFSEIAASVLGDCEPASWLDVERVLCWTAGQLNLPRQLDIASDFGQPPITLYWDERFSIDILVWTDATTSIHQHAFSGAFAPLVGTSLHAVYGFQRSARISEHMLVGNLRGSRLELLKPGDVRPVEPGSALIHSVFHLARPSVTLVVRTHRGGEFLPQYTYHKPGLAIDPRYVPPSQQRMVDVVAAALEFGETITRRVVEEALRRPDPIDAFAALSVVSDHKTGRSLIEDFFPIVSREHGDVGRNVIDAVRIRQTQMSLVRLRGHSLGFDQRLVVALLLHASSRSQLLQAVGVQYPEDDPVTMTARLLCRFTTSLHDEQDGSYAHPNMKSPDAAVKWVLTQMLLGHSTAQMHRMLEAGLGAEFEQVTAEKVTLISLSLPLMPSLALLFVDETVQ